MYDPNAGPGVIAPAPAFAAFAIAANLPTLSLIYSAS
jgi:hypothetical protein